MLEVYLNYHTLEEACALLGKYKYTGITPF